MPEIIFDAKFGDWVCIKKQKVEDGAPKIEAARILASIMDTIGRKSLDFLKDDFPLAELDKAAYEIAGAQFDEKKKDWIVKNKNIEESLAKLNNPSTSRKISEVLNPKTKNGPEIAKTYVAIKTFDLLGFRISLDPKVIEKYIEEKSKL